MKIASSNGQLSLLRFSVHHPKTVLGLVIIALFAVSPFISRVRLKLDASSLIPIDNSKLIASLTAANHFNLRDVIVVGVVNEESSIYNPETLKRILRISKAVSHMDGVVEESTISLATAPNPSLSENKIEILPLIDEGEDFSPERIQRLRAEIDSKGFNNGILTASDGSAAAVYAEVEREADRYRVLSQARELVKQEEGGDDSIHLSGTALAQAVLGESAALDLVRLIPAVIFVLGAVLFMAFRALAPAVISLAEILASLILTIGVMGLLQESVFVTTLVLPVILISVGVSDDVYALTHYFNERRHSRDRRESEVILAAFTRILRPVGLTAISTIVGLLSLALTSIEPLRVFGIFGAVAILISSLFTFTLVPALITILRPQLAATARKGTHRRQAMFGLIHHLTAVGPRRFLLIGLVTAVCAVLLGLKVKVDDNWIRNLPKTSDIAQGDGRLNSSLAGTTTIELMLSSGDRYGFMDPVNFAALGAVEAAAIGAPYVGAVHSAFTEVARANAALRNRDYHELRNALLRNETTLTREEIRNALITLSTAKGIPRADYFAFGFESTRVTIFVRDADYERIGNVLRAVSSAGLGLNGAIRVSPFGDGWISYLTVQLLVKGQMYSIGLALLTDLALLSILFGSFRTGLTAIIPVAFSILIVLAVLAATRTPLGIANSMFAAIAIGIGLDFSIHLTSAYQEGIARGFRESESLMRAAMNTGPAVIASAIALSAGFSVLALSTVTPNLQLGLMICLSLLVCAGATLLLIPSFALLRRRNRATGKAALSRVNCAGS